MSGLWFVIAGLVTWRAGVFLAGERGLFSIGERIRAGIGIVPASDGTPSRDDGGELLRESISDHEWVDSLAYELGEGITCVWCNSVWLALPVLILLGTFQPDFVTTPAQSLLSWGGLTAIACIVQSFTRG